MTKYIEKSRLEYYVKAKPSTEESPGYFDDGGTFHRGPVYSAKLGKEYVAIKNDWYNQTAGFYMTRQGALDGAKLFQSEMKRLLEEGKYTED